MSTIIIITPPPTNPAAAPKHPARAAAQGIALNGYRIEFQGGCPPRRAMLGALWAIARAWMKCRRP